MKKNEARFTIKFNPANPRHREAIRMLNEAGRCKASLIADALCVYAHYATACDDLLNEKNSVRKVARIKHQVTEIEGMALLAKSVEENKDILFNSQSDEEGFWKCISDSVTTFFD